VRRSGESWLCLFGGMRPPGSGAALRAVAPAGDRAADALAAQAPHGAALAAPRGLL